MNKSLLEYEFGTNNLIKLGLLRRNSLNEYFPNNYFDMKNINIIKFLDKIYINNNIDRDIILDTMSYFLERDKSILNKCDSDYIKIIKTIHSKLDYYYIKLVRYMYLNKKEYKDLYLNLVNIEKEYRKKLFKKEDYIERNKVRL